MKNNISTDIINQIDYALKKFGEYTFADKGPYEVMDIESISNKLNELEINIVAEILSEVLDNYENVSKIGKYEHAVEVVDSIITNLDDRDDFEDLFQYDKRFKY